ncbi:fumarylacetoacetate hydrolase family protein [Micromonospora sp. NPDC005206]|uniref:fumarylacetoacetate hydrolase family protein n=1 Tax=Micromonospora sp. NPDC005206 TaxID=3157022 RepID=UPI0033B46C56
MAMTPIRLLRLGPLGEEVPALLDETGAIRDLRPLTDDIDGRFLASNGIERARAAVGELPLLPDADALRVGAPIARPSAVICIGQNFGQHAAEMGAPPPSRPIVFFKHPNTVVGPHDDILVPLGAEKIDWEVELGVVIGTRARYLGSPEEALAHVAGFVVSDDVSERHYQLEESLGQWSKGKCFETFNPVGPWLVPADQVAHQRLRMWSTVNGEVRQDSTTADMVFSVAELVHQLSQFLVLEPGDLINTGTPQGVALSGRFPFLAVGDVLEMGIEGLGSHKQQLVPTRLEACR